CFVSSLCLPDLSLFSFHGHLALRSLLSFPTRRSSDLQRPGKDGFQLPHAAADGQHAGISAAAEEGTAGDAAVLWPGLLPERLCIDRKSTRLNSSHVSISYAVFCLKKRSKCDRIVATRG